MDEKKSQEVKLSSQDSRATIKKQQEVQKQTKNQKEYDYKQAPADLLFLNHISYLNQLSYTNLVEVNSEELSRDNQHTIKKLTNKKPIKTSPELKYFYCKSCEIMLIPGETSKIRIKSKRNKHVVSTCLNCGMIKRYNLAHMNKEKKEEPKT